MNDWHNAVDPDQTKPDTDDRKPSAGSQLEGVADGQLILDAREAENIEYLTKAFSHSAIEEAMVISWDDICTDTGCHPLDITHGKNKHLMFRPNHWANQIAKRLFLNALKLRGRKIRL